MRPFYGTGMADANWQARPQVPAHWAELVEVLAEQNPSASGAAALEALRSGAGVVVTGQQVGLFGGPLFTPFKAATALARARQATAAGKPHVAMFWLATEDHDFAEINHVTFPARRGLRKLVYDKAPDVARPVGGVVLDETITPLMEQAWELLGYSDAMEALAAAYQPGRTFAQAFAEFYSKVFARAGAAGAGCGRARPFIAWVRRCCARRWSERTSCMRRWWSATARWRAAGYHAQVAVAPQSSLLFLIDERSGARVALKRLAASAAEPDGLWQAGRERYSTADLLGFWLRSRSGFRLRRCCGQCFRIFCFRRR